MYNYVGLYSAIIHISFMLSVTSCFILIADCKILTYIHLIKILLTLKYFNQLSFLYVSPVNNFKGFSLLS